MIAYGMQLHVRIYCLDHRYDIEVKGQCHIYLNYLTARNATESVVYHIVKKMLSLSVCLHKNDFLVAIISSGDTLGHFFKPEKNLEFFRLKNAPEMSTLVGLSD